jgi:hypothetical protein
MDIDHIDHILYITNWPNKLGWKGFQVTNTLAY